MKYETIVADIEKIDISLRYDNEQGLKDMHLYIDGKYSSIISNMGQGMYAYMEPHGFIYDSLNDKASLEHNLKLMKAKLSGYAEENCEKPKEIEELAIIKLIKQVPEVRSWFKTSNGALKVIYNDKRFIQWKNKILFELKKLKQDDFILEIKVLLNSIKDGWNDEKHFENVSSKLEILADNIEEYQKKQEEVKDKSISIVDNKKIFIVHGHDEKLKLEMSNWLRSLDLSPIILHLTANMGIKTIIDKIQENSDVGCAIVLMTADDLGKAKMETELKPRARQNVVFEAGYFLGKLGAKKVILLYDKGLEAPGDLSGCVYIEADPYGGWKEQVRTEFKAMGIQYSK